MYGLIGGKLGHSYSKMIHEQLADYEYSLIPLEQNEFEEFMTKRDFTAINVTIPYKEAVIPYLDELHPAAKAIGAVNTIFRKDGKLIGANTDYYGFEYLLLNNNIEIKDRTCMILGNGGAAKAIKAVLNNLGSKAIVIVNIIDEPNTISYDQAYRDYKDADIIINTSPVGMFPEVDKAPIDLSKFNDLKAVVDIVYNPTETKLYKDASSLGIPAVTGLEMLVAQAKEAVEYFTNQPIAIEEIDRIYKEILKEI